MTRFASFFYIGRGGGIADLFHFNSNYTDCMELNISVGFTSSYIFGLSVLQRRTGPWRGVTSGHRCPRETGADENPSLVARTRRQSQRNM